MTLSDSIVDRRLPIFVLAIDVVFALLDEILDSEVVALTAGIEDWSLLERVISARAHSHVSQQLDHLEGKFVIGDRCCGENGRLTELVFLVNDDGDIDVELSHHADDFLDLATLDLLEQLLV